MKKPFLLIMGSNWYPGGGTEDWKACCALARDIISSAT
jgi:hypothetical protein